MVFSNFTTGLHAIRQMVTQSGFFDSIGNPEYRNTDTGYMPSFLSCKMHDFIAIAENTESRKAFGLLLFIQSTNLNGTAPFKGT